MAKIRAEDIAEVRDRARLDDVVAQTVALKPAGGGSYKGLCPFHDERSPSFHVSPAKGLWYCFGCGEGGDTIDFVMRTDGVTFAEAVEKLAGRFGVELHYEEGTAAARPQQGQKVRLAAANAAAADFFRAQLATPAAQRGRDFLSSRNFDEDAWERYGIGYAPQSWDALTTHLRGRGFSDAELSTAGLVASGNRGNYDRFRGRLVWPIKDLSGDVVGFGARKLRDDDNGPKYLNTPETPLYKKSRVLYGIDLARQAISKAQQAVVVEGYTDVMACHLAGVPNAVATCGTAFGEGHVKVLRRLLFDDESMRGEVVFTFDGDAAGRRAALRAFESDQSFVGQTYVAVQPDGLDPCEARINQGDEAVRALVQGRVPLFEFAIRSTLEGYRLDSAEGRVTALRATAPMVRSIRDLPLRREYVVQLSGWLGMDPVTVGQAVGQAAVPTAGQRPGSAGARPERRPDPRAGGRSDGDRGGSPSASYGRPQPGPRRQGAGVLADPDLERHAIQVMLQHPHIVAEWITTTEESAFTDPVCLAVFAAIRDAGDVPEEEADVRVWLLTVLDRAADDDVRQEIRRQSVLALPIVSDVDPAGYAQGVMARLHSWDVVRRITPLKGKLARLDPSREAEAFSTLMNQLMELENYRRELQEMARGEV